MPYDYDGTTNQFVNRGISPDLQSIIDKVSGSFSGISRGRAAMLQADLAGKAMGIMGGLQQQGLQEAGSTERTKLGIAGQEQTAKIGIQPQMADLNRTPFKGLGLRMKMGIGDVTEQAEQKKPTTLDDILKGYM